MTKQKQPSATRTPLQEEALPQPQWTQEGIAEYIVDTHALEGVGWQTIAKRLNECGAVDVTGHRWTARRVENVYEALPDKTPSFDRPTPPGRNILAELCDGIDDGERLRPLPDTVVGRRALWKHVKGV